MTNAATTPATPAAAPQIDNLRGIGWALISVVGASAMSIAVREMSLTIDSRMIVTLRAAATVACFLPMLLFMPSMRRLRFSRPWLHLLRGVLIGGATHLGFYTLAEIPLATATVLFFTAPIFATLIGALFLGERVGPRRWAAVLVGFMGAVVILRPGAGALEPAMLAALASSAMFAVALSLSRAVAQADGTQAAFVSATVVMLVTSLPLSAGVMELPGSPWVWGMLLVVILGGAVRSLADIQSYRIADASVVGPVSYLRLVLMGGAGFLFFAEVPDGYTILGAAIVIAATLYLARREAALRREARAARAASAAG
ncbi:DMT family transporter [Halovulum dunhuangense]|uniref:DMT family transporter n=1 Tax=Halovulum dunhuangense TaxID=1505036 RepID=A0A849L5S8_9RHOB|nr:DMT family transporter [Halovulum dunhuangense]NNU81481.1 DMT family transporter [Halovulum dunhuangense]